MGSKKNDAPTWAEQWGSGRDEKDAGGSGGNLNGEKKTVTSNVKAAASETYVKGKAASLVGAQKVKSGTSSGIKWVKDQYQKRVSK